MKRRAATLTPSELEIMKIVWQRGEVTVRDVYETLLARRRIAYTTVMTVMKLLEDKGLSPVAYLADLVPTASHVPYPYIMAYDVEPLRTLES